MTDVLMSVEVGVGPLGLLSRLADANDSFVAVEMRRACNNAYIQEQIGSYLHPEVEPTGQVLGPRKMSFRNSQMCLLRLSDEQLDTLEWLAGRNKTSVCSELREAFSHLVQDEVLDDECFEARLAETYERRKATVEALLVQAR